MVAIIHSNAIEADWSLIFTILTQIISWAFVAGIGWTKLRTLEKDILRLETEVVEYRTMHEDLAVVKNQLQNIQFCLNRLASEVEKDMKQPEL